MFKSIFVAINILIALQTGQAHAIQVIHRTPYGADSYERNRINQMNMQEESQQMMRDQVRMQQEALKTQQETLRLFKYGY